MRHFDLDWKIILPSILLVIFSLTTLLSIDINFFKSQLLFVFVGIIFFILLTRLDYRLFKRFCIHIYIVSLIIFSILLVIGIEARGATRWFEIAGLRIQFSELLKPFLLLSLSSYLVENEEKLILRVFALTILATTIVSLLVFLEPDLGNAIIYIIVSFLVLFYLGFPIRYFSASALLAGLTLPIFWLILREYQRQRILTFLNPGLDPLGVSYNAIQAIIAVGSGEFLGRGLGFGTQSQLRFLPERHTDFIFATLSEQFGFIGSITVVILFGFLLYRIFIVVRDTQDKFGQLFAASSFFLILFQSFMNIGMNLGIVPIAGVTLPLVSYGGSSLVSTFIILGIISSIGRHFKYKDVLEIR